MSVAYSRLGKGFLTGAVRSAADVPPDSRLASAPRAEPGNLERNVPIVDGLGAIASRVGCTAQLALAWLLAQADVAPIPGVLASPTCRRSWALWRCGCPTATSRRWNGSLRLVSPSATASRLPVQVY